MRRRVNRRGCGPHFGDVPEMRHQRAPSGQARPAQIARRRPLDNRAHPRPDRHRIVGVEHESIGEVGKPVEHLGRAATPPHERREAGEAQRRHRVVQIVRRQPFEGDRVLRDADDRHGLVAVRNENRTDRDVGQFRQGIGGFAQPLGRTDDHDRGGEREAGRALAVLSAGAAERRLDLRERHLDAVLQQAARGRIAHSVLQRRPSRVISASASAGPHSPAS